MRAILFPAFAGIAMSASAQYAPQAGISGSTAIAAGSSQIVAWASGCSLQRGYKDVAQPQMGYATSGDSASAIGAADNFIVSLGDSGVATLSFPHPIVNGAGADFVVFENGFANPANAEEAFLELAFVEVSSDGIHYFRFPSSSLTQTDAQIPGAGVYMNARMLNNLAGKYIANNGTPFDLQEMEGISGLDVNNIIRVRVIDVIGSIGAHASWDKDGNIINDPYPTAFPTGGFDLDAVGVINQNMATGIGAQQKPLVKVYPNPTAGEVRIEATKAISLTVRAATGSLLLQKSNDANMAVDLSKFGAGIYFFHFKDSEGRQWVERITKL